MTKPSETDIQANALLKSMRGSDRDLLLPYLELCDMRLGEVIYMPGDDVMHTYFPCGPTMVAFAVILDEDYTVEASLIGREGAVGGIVSQGHLPAYCKAIVQFPGKILKIETAKLEQAKGISLTLRYFFARYADCLMAQVFQSVACNAVHSIEQRTAKWLVMALEHTGTIIPLKQEQLASMLGVGRSYVARIIGTLKVRGILETRRGRLCIHDVETLKSLSCNCNNLVRRHFTDVLQGVYDPRV